MSLIDTHHIKKNSSTDLASNFELLLAQAIALTQQLSSQTWTDYNLHDPGITILEQVCFAITDLSYKTEFPIEDLLTDAQGNISRTKNSFFEKQKALTCNPVTVNDLRKAILDKFPEVDNVVLYPIKSRHTSEYIKGLYNIIIRLSKTEPYNHEKNENGDIEKQVMNFFLDKRNLSEDLNGNITTLEPQQIQLSADIIIKYNTAPEEVLANIINSLEAALNPKVSRFSEKELLQGGMTIEEIYSGPMLENGFIPDDALKPINDTIDPIELANVISQVEGVVFVKKLLRRDTQEVDGWKPIILDKGCCPTVDIDYFAKNVRLITDDYIIPINQKLLIELINRTEQLSIQKHKVYLAQPDTEHIKLGKYRNPGAYHSLQTNFPTVFGIGPDGLSSRETKERKAAARQLKAYLLIFEQIMANYLAQLENISNLYSTLEAPMNQHSYFHQPLYSIPRVEEILAAFTSGSEKGDGWKEFMANQSNDYIKAMDKAIESPETKYARKERVIDHLLARFNIQVNGLPALLYFNLYLLADNRKKAQFLLKWKSEILNNCIENSYNRVKAFNYRHRADNLSGFEKNVAMYLHLKIRGNQKLTEVFETGNIALVSEKTEVPFTTEFYTGKILTNTEGLKIDIISNSDEVLSLGNMDKVIVGRIENEYGYIFRYQRIEILKYGINLNNYKIVCPSGSAQHLIIYKAPKDEKWMIIGRRNTKEEAIISLKKLVAYLKNISLESEGFYVMEHLLLRPELELPTFGFQFRDSSRVIVLKNDQWTSFEAREAHLDWLVDAHDHVDTDGKKIPLVSFQLKVLESPDKWEVMESEDFCRLKKHPLYLVRQHILAEIKKINKDKTTLYPRFEFMVKLPDDTIIEEAFYNQRVTVALPAWPARFQDSEFRLFCENLFRSMAPAYLRLEFRWLGIARMKKFEDIYFQLFEQMKQEVTSDQERYQFSAPMTAWLRERNTRK